MPGGEPARAVFLVLKKLLPLAGCHREKSFISTR